jgi:hypothetical protein
MIMTPRLRKFALTAHIIFSVGWLGAVVAYLALVIAVLVGSDAQTARSAWFAMELIGWFAIVPLALSSLLTGLVQAMGTQWGLFRHYWVLFKLLLTVIATTILVLHMPTVSALAGLAADTTLSITDLPRVQGELLHAGGGLLVLLVTTILSVYKPRGMTPYGRRKQHEQRRTSNTEAGIGALNRGSTTSTPFWVKVFGTILALLLMLLVIRMLLSDGHGPGRHAPPGGLGEHMLPESLGPSACGRGVSPRDVEHECNANPKRYAFHRGCHSRHDRSAG